MTTSLLTDPNIELIVGQLRSMLQRNAVQIESDLPLTQGQQVEVALRLVIKQEKSEGSSKLFMEYTPVVRKDSARVNLLDVRQMSLIA